MAVTIRPNPFTMVLFDADDIGRIVGEVAALVGVDRDMVVEVDEKTPLGRTFVTSLDPVTMAFLLLVLVCAVFAPLVAPHSPSAQSISERLQPPAWSDGGSWSHVLGTDNLGRDVLSRVIWGSQTALRTTFSCLSFRSIARTTTRSKSWCGRC